MRRPLTRYKPSPTTGKSWNPRLRVQRLWPHGVPRSVRARWQDTPLRVPAVMSEFRSTHRSAQDAVPLFIKSPNGGCACGAEPRATPQRSSAADAEHTKTQSRLDCRFLQHERGQRSSRNSVGVTSQRVRHPGDSSELSAKRLKENLEILRPTRETLGSSPQPRTRSPSRACWPRRTSKVPGSPNGTSPGSAQLRAASSPQRAVRSQCPTSPIGS